MGGVPYPIFFCANLLVRVKLGYPPNFNFLGKPLLGEKYVHGKRKKKEEERIMPSLVATTSTPARKPFVRTHYVRTNRTPFSEIKLGSSFIISNPNLAFASISTKIQQSSSLAAMTSFSKSSQKLYIFSLLSVS